MTAAVSVQGLTKRFARLTALDDVTFDVPEHSLFGLLGPNGAGKTTLFSVAAGFLRATKGTVEVLGVDVREISKLRGRFSMLPQDASFQASVPILDQLIMFSRMSGASAAEAEEQSREALELVGLGDIATQRARTLSHGMMKRVTLCQAFLGRPEVIFLDEPTAGLDPKTAHDMRRLIRDLRTDRTIVLSSHNLREIQEICDYAAILDAGALEICDSMAALTGANFLVRIALTKPLPPEAEEALVGLPMVSSLERTGDDEFNLEMSLDEAGKDEAIKTIQRVLLVDHDLAMRTFHEGESLEARFLEITGGTYDGASGS